MNYQALNYSNFLAQNHFGFHVSTQNWPNNLVFIQNIGSLIFLREFKIMPDRLDDWLKTLYVVLTFCSVLCFGALKSQFLHALSNLVMFLICTKMCFSGYVCFDVAGLIVGPVACSILIVGNLGVILGFFPAHVSWTVYSLLK